MTGQTGHPTCDIHPGTVGYVLNEHEKHMLDVDETVRMICVATQGSREGQRVEP